MKFLEVCFMVLVTATLLSGCGSDSDKDNPNPDSKIVIEDETSILEGVWQSECIVVNNTLSYKTLNIYHGNHFETYSRLYIGDTCNVNYSRYEMKGTFNIKDQRTLENGQIVNLIPHKMDSFHFAYYRDLEVTAANIESACGINTWHEGELQNLTTCPFYVNKYSELLEIIYLNEDKMYGGNNNNRGDDGYPLELANNFLTHKKPTELQGNWIKECFVEDNASYKKIHTYIGNTMHFEQLSYSDTNCVDLLFNVKVSYIYDLGAERILNSGETVREISTNIYEYEAAFFGLETINEVNTSAAFKCGKSVWIDGKFKDVLECDWSFNALTKVFKTVFKVEDQVITYGDDMHIGDDGYPTQLQDSYYSRQ